MKHELKNTLAPIPRGKHTRTNQQSKTQDTPPNWQSTPRACKAPIRQFESDPLVHHRCPRRVSVWLSTSHETHAHTPHDTHCFFIAEIDLESKVASPGSVVSDQIKGYL
jgi:hypothetical protein